MNRSMRMLLVDAPSGTKDRNLYKREMRRWKRRTTNFFLKEGIQDHETYNPREETKPFWMSIETEKKAGFRQVRNGQPYFPDSFRSPEDEWATHQMKMRMQRLPGRPLDSYQAHVEFDIFRALYDEDYDSNMIDVNLDEPEYVYDPLITNED